MKLRLGEVLIETDYIEAVERMSEHTVKIFFVSGHTMEVLCDIKGASKATWGQDANAFIQTVHNTDALKHTEKKTGKNE